MKEVVNSPFSLESHRIRRFLLQDPEEKVEGINIQFGVEGELLLRASKYVLTMNVFVSIGKDEGFKFIEATVEAIFKFENPIKLQEVPDYFYPNSIAIVFPYLRAFISTLTAVANINPLILPTLNLTGLQDALKENTKAI